MVCFNSRIFAIMNSIKFLRLLAFGLLFAQCSHQGDQTSAAPPPGMIAYDLSKFGKPFVIFVPDTTRTPLKLSDESSGALSIESGNAFAVSIREQKEDLALRKKDIAEDEVNRLHTMIVDSADAIVWESGITAPEFHFILNRKIAGGEYAFEDKRDSEHAPFSKDAIMKMYGSCSAAYKK